MNPAAQALSDQIAAATRDAGPKVEVSEFEMRALVSLADIGLMYALAFSGLPQAVVALENATAAAKLWNDSHERIGPAECSALYASIIMQDRFGKFNLVRNMGGEANDD